jgi:excisionase family DNA binding protein
MRARAALLLPPELIDAVAERVLRVLDERVPSHQHWMGVAEAAEHLCCSKHRIYHLVSERRIPHEREGARLLFDRQALDAWVRLGGAR